MSRAPVHLRRVGVLFWILAGALAAVPAAAQSLPDALEAIQRARVTTRILYITAHPDDESSSVLTYLARGLGADVALLSITRGEGGQNALGPEQGPPLGILRTEELLAATRAYGVRLYFTRAPDFGYSKTPEETLSVWGDTALDDMVRIIRTFRPHVVINNWGGVHWGHGHHQAAGLLTPRAVKMAADSNAFPKQLEEGLSPVDGILLLELARGETPRGFPLPLDDVSPLWGRNYRELGLEGFKNHRTQGVAAFLNSPFFRRTIALVPADGEVFDPSRLAAPLAKLGASRPADQQKLARADESLALAREAALRLDWPAAVTSLAAAGRELAALRAEIKELSDAAAVRLREELAYIAPRIDAALALAAALRIEVQADRSEVVAGENFSVRVDVQRRVQVPGEVGKPSLALPAGWGVTKEEADPTGGVRFTVAIPKDAKPLRSANDWILPWPPPLVEARVRVQVDAYSFSVAAPATAQRVTSTRVDTLPLTLVPAVTLALEPRQFVVTIARPPKQLELLARVRSYSAAPAKVLVGVDVPEGWRISEVGPLEFSSPGDQLVRFTVTPPAKLSAGNYALSAWASRDGEKLRTSLEPLVSLPTRLWSEPAAALVHAFDLAVPEGLRVGYVAAENDPILAALRQLGVQVEVLDPVALAFSDLRRFDAIAIGIRAYELRDDLARANPRLFDYVAAGGALVVQYQRENVWAALKPAPYPATIGQPTVRITDENSPVRFLVPGHPVLNFPNKISQDDFKGWVQERGLYFWSQWDSRYQPLLALRDPGEEEATGGLLHARFGTGVYIYTGLAFFRQLPEGVPGAYRLFINLLSQSRAPKGPGPQSGQKGGRSRPSRVHFSGWNLSISLARCQLDASPAENRPENRPESRFQDGSLQRFLLWRALQS